MGLLFQELHSSMVESRQEAGGYIVSAGRKKGEHSWPSLLSLLLSVWDPMKWCYRYLGWAFPSLLSLS